MYLILDILAVSSHWIVKTGLKRHKHNYEDLCRDILGPVGGYLHCVYTWIFSFTGCLAYMIIAGQNLADVGHSLGGTGIFGDRRFFTACCVVIVLPLCLLRDMVS